jgi:hypothetical protein
MDSIRQLHGEVKPTLAAAAVFFCTAVSIASMFLMAPHGSLMLNTGRPWADITVITGPVTLLCASILVFFRPTFGYILGGIGGMIALPWFVLTEIYSLGSIWTYLNTGSDWIALFGAYPIVIAKLKFCPWR